MERAGTSPNLKEESLNRDYELLCDCAHKISAPSAFSCCIDKHIRANLFLLTRHFRLFVTIWCHRTLNKKAKHDSSILYVKSGTASLPLWLDISYIEAFHLKNKSRRINICKRLVNFNGRKTSSWSKILEKSQFLKKKKSGPFSIIQTVPRV